MSDQVALSHEQLAFGLFLARQIDKIGSAIMPAEVVHDHFRESVDALEWLCENNLWQMKTDTILGIVTFTGQSRKNAPARLPIRTLLRQLRKAERKGIKAFDVPCEY